MALTPIIVQKGPGLGAACPDANLLASHLDGRVTAEERVPVEAHLARCEDCYFVFSETFQEPGSGTEVAAVTEVKPPRRSSGFGLRAAAALAAAAAVVLAVQAYRVSTVRPTGDVTETFRVDTGQEMASIELALNELDAAAGAYRTFEGRLTGGTRYRALAAPVRSASVSSDPPLAMREAALKVERAAQERSSEALRALAAMYLTLGDGPRAAEAVGPIARTATDPELLNDIAVAYLARGSEGDANHAMTLLERAAAQAPHRPEPWFNLGLAAEAVGNPSHAVEAWTRYLAIDSTSPWAAEARAHVSKLNTGSR